MEHHIIKLNDQEISYELRVSQRARGLRLEIGSSGLIIIKPRLVPTIFVEQFIKKQTAWIIKNLAKYGAAEALPAVSRDELVILKKRAAKLLIARLEFFNEQYHFKYKSITIRNQKTRWGSCSKQGALNFNYRLIQLPPELLDYVAVHELCHLKEMNHSARFWSLVGRTLPDYQERRRALQKFRLF